MIPTFAPDFDKPGKIMVFIAITADTAEAVRMQLNDMMHDQEKLLQGIYVNGESTRQVITPFWNGKKY